MYVLEYNRSSLRSQRHQAIIFRDTKTINLYTYLPFYRSASEMVPKKDYELPIGKADVVVPGEDVTLIAWGTQLHVMREVAQLAQEKLGVSCEVIDMVSILPWDTETVYESVKKTGRCIIAHEAPLTNGFGAELASSIQVLVLIILCF